jgi:hypothetical protein
MTGLRVFFTQHTQLELAALVSLTEAERMKAPTTSKEDEKVQAFIVARKDAAKIGEAHWELITSTLHGWHRRATARRALITATELKAADIAQKHHNKYVDDENRRVAREAEEQREANERAAEVERQKELDALERKALLAESKSADLSDRDKAFVDLIMLGEATTRAAQRAGYKEPAASGERLLQTAKIQKAIKVAKEAAALRRQAAAVAERPLDVKPVEVTEARVTKAAGVSERESHTAVVVDLGALVEAFRSGKHGIPGSIFAINQTELNVYAKSLRENLNRWPGVQYKKGTSTF